MNDRFYLSKDTMNLVLEISKMTKKIPRSFYTVILISKLTIYYHFSLKSILKFSIKSHDFLNFWTKMSDKLYFQKSFHHIIILRSVAHIFTMKLIIYFKFYLS